MKGEEYRAIRKRIGTQAEVAERLGVHRVTIADRERGAQPISRESELAILMLATDIKPTPPE